MFNSQSRERTQTTCVKFSQYCSITNNTSFSPSTPKLGEQSQKPGSLWWPPPRLYIDKAKRKTPLTEEISYLLLQLLSCSSLEAYILELMCTFQTTTYTLHHTDYSAFSFSAISSSSTLHCYSMCWHLNFLTVLFPVQVLDSGEKYVIKDRLSTPVTKFTLCPHCQSHVLNR